MSERAYIEYQENNRPRQFDINKNQMVLGRAPDCDLILPFPQVSRQHAQLSKEGILFYIQDLKSANGTYVNGKQVTDRQSLRDKDEVRLGEFVIFFHQPGTKQIFLTDELDMDASMTISFPITRMADGGIFSKPKARDPHEMVQLVFNAAKTLVGSTELEQVLNRVMGLVFEYLKPDRGLLMLYDDDEGQLMPQVIQHSSKKSSGNLNFSRTIVNKVFQEQVSILTSNAMRDQRFATNESIMIQQIRSCMCVPLWDERKIIGIIYIDSQSFENLFTERDLDLLSTIAVISAIAIEQSRLNEVIQREKAIRGRLERYHSPAVINRIIDSGGDDIMKTEEREITVLFADLVGFTTFSERLDPAEVARVLNTHFNAVTDVIFRYEGTLDKYIGDAVMAVFGAPLPQADHARRAVLASIEMFKAMELINDANILPHKLQMRIGINTGKVVAGDIGSEKRVDYTVLGSNVNIASRIESSVAKAGEIVIGEATRKMIGDDIPLVDLGARQLRGLSIPLNVFRVEIPR